MLAHSEGSHFWQTTTPMPPLIGDERGPDILHRKVDDNIRCPVRHKVGQWLSSHSQALGCSPRSARCKGKRNAIFAVNAANRLICPSSHTNHLNILSLPAMGCAVSTPRVAERYVPGDGGGSGGVSATPHKPPHQIYSPAIAAQPATRASAYYKPPNEAERL